MRRDREIDLLPSKIVGRRVEREHTLEDADILARFVRELHGTIAPRGLYRFASFEEADAWMTTNIRRRLDARSSKTSVGSANVSPPREPVTS